jgi:nucleotide-binding universal stress UspA family protein
MRTPSLVIALAAVAAGMVVLRALDGGSGIGWSVIMLGLVWAAVALGTRTAQPRHNVATARRGAREVQARGNPALRWQSGPRIRDQRRASRDRPSHRRDDTVYSAAGTDEAVTRVLCAWDSRTAADVAVPAALALARDRRAELELLMVVREHVLPWKRSRAAGLPEQADVLERAIGATVAAGQESPAHSVRFGSLARQASRRGRETQAHMLVLGGTRPRWWALLSGRPEVDVQAVTLAPRPDRDTPLPQRRHDDTAGVERGAEGRRRPQGIDDDASPDCGGVGSRRNGP